MIINDHQWLSIIHTVLCAICSWGFWTIPFGRLRLRQAELDGEILIEAPVLTGPHHMPGHGAFHIWGYGLQWKILLKGMMNRGTPILGNHHMPWYTLIYCNCSLVAVAQHESKLSWCVPIFDPEALPATRNHQLRRSRGLGSLHHPLRPLVFGCEMMWVSHPKALHRFPLWTLDPVSTRKTGQLCTSRGHLYWTWCQLSANGTSEWVQVGNSHD